MNLLESLRPRLLPLDRAQMPRVVVLMFRDGPKYPRKRQFPDTEFAIRGNYLARFKGLRVTKGRIDAGMGFSST